MGGLLSFNAGSFTNSTYTFLTGTSVTNTFTSVTNLPTGYQVVYGSNSVYLQLISQLGPVSTSFTGTNAVITGGSTNFIVTVTNSAPVGSDSLVFTGTNGTNVSGSVGSTTITPQGSASVSNRFAFVGTNVAQGRTGGNYQSCRRNPASLATILGLAMATASTSYLTPTKLIGARHFRGPIPFRSRQREQ